VDSMSNGGRGNIHPRHFSVHFQRVLTSGDPFSYTAVLRVHTMGLQGAASTDATFRISRDTQRHGFLQVWLLLSWRLTAAS
jgi:hypothetical protein